MPYIARKNPYDDTDKIINISDLDYKDYNKDYYCPYCNAKFYVRSVDSNKRNSHFVRYKKTPHETDCRMITFESTIKKQNFGDISSFDPTELLHKLQNTNNTNKISSSRSTKVATQNNTTLHLTTLRNLYNFCVTHNIDYRIKNSLYIKDIFVSKSTSHIYSKYITGIKLVECKYVKSNADYNFFIFKYNNLIIKAKTNSPIMFDKINNKINADPNKLFIIFGKFKTNKFKDINNTDCFVCLDSTKQLL